MPSVVDEVVSYVVNEVLPSAVDEMGSSVNMRPFHMSKIKFLGIATSLNQIDQIKHPLREFSPSMSVP